MTGDLTSFPLSPLDGRYRTTVAPLANHLSEAALNRARITVMVEWVIFLTERELVPGAPKLAAQQIADLRKVAALSAADVAALAEIERVTVHDVKACEYFIVERLAGALQDSALAERVTPLVHFACTSEDVNNLAYALTIRAAITDIWLPAAQGLIGDLADLAQENAAVPMLARTHGQAATPTTLGKELAVFAHRLRRQARRVSATEFLGKFNGATGTYGAHVVAAPGVDWPAAAKDFVTSFGLTWNPLTTQIESHDWQAELFADVARFNRIAHNLATDMWTYISLGYFQQVRGQGTVGSSTMPHKVNPIRFENAEANLEISCALLDSLAATLVTSRLQRDLTDSTTQRNIGVGLGHSLLALDNLRRGLAGLAVDHAALEADLAANWEVLAEPIQSVMRAAGAAGEPGMGEPYERLKDLTRGQQVDAETITEFIAGLGLPDEAAERLRALSPSSYTGLAEQLVRTYLSLDDS
jgi:adenylosuccinate lyase